MSRRLMLMAIAIVAVHANSTVLHGLLAFDGAVAADVDSADPVAKWPRFRGPNGSGVAVNDRPAPIQCGPATNVLWTADVASAPSSPIVYGDRLFLTSFDAETRTLHTHCFNRHDGNELWRRTAAVGNPEKTHPVSSPAAPTPAADDQRIYVYCGSIGLLAYSHTGELQWTTPLPTPVNRHGSASSPVVVGGLVCLCCDQGEEFSPRGSFLLAVDCATGNEVWRKDRPESASGWTTPIVRTAGPETELIVNGRRLMAYESRTGEDRWLVHGLMDYAITLPVLGGGLVFAGSAAGGLDLERRIKFGSFSVLLEQHDRNNDDRLTLDELPEHLNIYEGDSGGIPGDVIALHSAFNFVDHNNDNAISSNEWTRLKLSMGTRRNKLVAARAAGRGDITDSAVQWTATKSLPEVATPLFYRGLLYVVKNGGLVTCFDPAAGDVVYRSRLGATGSYFASPVAAGGHVYFASFPGEFTVIESGQELNVVHRMRFGEPIVATPAIADGTLYLRVGSTLFAFRNPTPAGVP